MKLLLSLCLSHFRLVSSTFLLGVVDWFFPILFVKLQYFLSSKNGQSLTVAELIFFARIWAKGTLKLSTLYCFIENFCHLISHKAT